MASTFDKTCNASSRLQNFYKTFFKYYYYELVYNNVQRTNASKHGPPPLLDGEKAG